MSVLDAQYDVEGSQMEIPMRTHYKLQMCMHILHAAYVRDHPMHDSVGSDRSLPILFIQYQINSSAFPLTK